MKNIGFQVLTRPQKISVELTQAFQSLPVANVSDCMSRLFASDASIRPIATIKNTIAGPALTVRTRPGDNLMVHYAIDIAEPGDILVVDAGGDTTNAIMGEIMASMAIKKKIAAIIINGAIRDANEIIKMGLPVYASGITHRGPYKDGPGEINTTISIGGMSITPGDLIVADQDGFLSVPIDDAKDILDKTKEKYSLEQIELNAIEDGSVDRSWVIDSLTKKGCSFN